jgi:hypothetical protein
VTNKKKKRQTVFFTKENNDENKGAVIETYIILNANFFSYVELSFFATIIFQSFYNPKEKKKN